MHDPQSPPLSSGCFLDALTSGQLGPTEWVSFVLPQPTLSTDEKESFVFLSVESQYAGSLQASTGLPVRATGL
jgi:hypothetical protein